MNTNNNSGALKTLKIVGACIAIAAFMYGRFGNVSSVSELLAIAALPGQPYVEVHQTYEVEVDQQQR